jgi:hypothetical protein
MDGNAHSGCCGGPSAKAYGGSPHVPASETAWFQLGGRRTRRTTSVINQRALDTYLAQSAPEEHSRFQGATKAIRYAVAASQLPPPGTSSGTGTRYEVHLPLVCDSLGDATAIAAEVATILTLDTHITSGVNGQC